MERLDAVPLPLTADPRFTGAVAGWHHRPDGDPRLHAYVVRFAAGSRTAWHSHAHGQLLVGQSGAGWVGTRDGRVVRLVPGVAVWTDPGEEHWHGADADQAMIHLAVQTAPPGGDSVTWLEPVVLAGTGGHR
ncbi:cupin domain-containing protein [Nakamurella endophytica]|nr:cupin domain-containing protein [Nakamurella endophytica]